MRTIIHREKVQRTVIFVATVRYPRLKGAAHRNICSNGVYIGVLVLRLVILIECVTKSGYDILFTLD